MADLLMSRKGSSLATKCDPRSIATKTKTVVVGGVKRLSARDPPGFLSVLRAQLNLVSLVLPVHTNTPASTTSLWNSTIHTPIDPVTSHPWRTRTPSTCVPVAPAHRALIPAQRAIEIVQRAIDEDTKQNYGEACRQYQNALDYFMLALKCEASIMFYERMPMMRV